MYVYNTTTLNRNRQKRMLLRRRFPRAAANVDASCTFACIVLYTSSIVLCTIVACITIDLINSLKDYSKVGNNKCFLRPMR